MQKPGLCCVALAEMQRAPRTLRPAQVLLFGGDKLRFPRGA